MEIIFNTIEEFWEMGPGEKIQEPEKLLEISTDVYTSRKTIKHVIESRKKDNYMIDDIKILFRRIPEVLQFQEYSMENKNQNYPGSKITGKYYFSEEKILLVIHQQKHNLQHIITAYYRTK